MEQFLERLKVLVEDFDLQKAMQLSDEMHVAEINGYEISDEEDTLWADLTNQIIDITA